MKATISIAGAFLLFGLPMGVAQAGACTSEIENLTKTMAASDAGSGPTSGASPSSSAGSARDTAQHPPTERVGQEVQGKAASPEDVRRQTTGQPTAADQAQSGRMSGAASKAEASAALDRARGLDKGGKEAECMEAVTEAKRLSGS